MSSFIETIKVKERKIFNLTFHQERLNRTRQSLFHTNSVLDLSRILTIPPGLDNSLYKLRVVYSLEIEKIEFVPYRMPVISNLALVYDNDIVYSFKSTNREKLTSLKKQCPGSSDIIIVKNGLLTDTSFSNIVCVKDNLKVTPKSPLLKGTKRELLLQTKKIEEADICPGDLKEFSKVFLINAMIDLEDEVCVGTESIR